MFPLWGTNEKPKSFTMPANFAEVWLNRVRRNLTAADAAPWLDGIPELDTEVLEVGSGSAAESNIIHLPTSSFRPDVLINNSAYPLALQAYTDSEVTIQLDKYQTKVTTLSDDQVMGASYDRIDNATRSHTEAILIKKFSKAIHALCPAGHTANTPVISTTGAADGTGRKRLVYADVVALKDAFDKMQIPSIGRRLVLSTDHWNDLLLDRQNFGDQLVNYKTGDVAPQIAGFQVYQYVENPYITAADKVKVAYGAAAAAGDYRASVAFYVPNVVKKTGLTKQYFADSKTDPENQTNRLNYRHYFIAVPAENKYIGAIASAE